MKILQCCILFVICSVTKINCSDIEHNDASKVSEIARRMDKEVSQAQGMSEIDHSKTNNQSIRDRIIGGTPAAKGELPWVVGIWRLKSSRPFCGGSLLNNR